MVRGTQSEPQTAGTNTLFVVGVQYMYLHTLGAASVTANRSIHEVSLLEIITSLYRMIGSGCMEQSDCIPNELHTNMQAVYMSSWYGTSFTPLTTSTYACKCFQQKTGTRSQPHTMPYTVSPRPRHYCTTVTPPTQPKKPLSIQARPRPRTRAGLP